MLLIPIARLYLAESRYYEDYHLGVSGSARYLQGKPQSSVQFNWILTFKRRACSRSSNKVIYTGLEQRKMLLPRVAEDPDGYRDEERVPNWKKLIWRRWRRRRSLSGRIPFRAVAGVLIRLQWGQRWSTWQLLFAAANPSSLAKAWPSTNHYAPRALVGGGSARVFATKFNPHRGVASQGVAS